jgi:hypothetical protein
LTATPTPLMNAFSSQTAREPSPYVPGEQPRIANVVKLNTNESPLGPSPFYWKRCESLLPTRYDFISIPIRRVLRHPGTDHSCRPRPKAEDTSAMSSTVSSSAPAEPRRGAVTRQTWRGKKPEPALTRRSAPRGAALSVVRAQRWATHTTRNPMLLPRRLEVTMLRLAERAPSSL